MGSKSILLISYYFPPSNMVAALRTYSFARYLAECGHNVTVMCCDDSSHGTDRSLDLDCTNFKTVRVDIGISGIKNIDYYNQKSLLSGHKRSRFIWALKNKFFRFLAKLKNGIIGNLLMPEDFWLAAAWRETRKLITNQKYDVVITSYGPISCHVIGYILKKKLNEIIWISDYRDPWCNNPHWSRPAWPLNSIQSIIQTRLNNYADSLITVSELLAKDYFAAHLSKMCIIENGYFPEDVISLPIQKSNKFIISYTGTFYEKSYKCDELFKGIKKALESGYFNNHIEINFYGSNTDSIFNAAERYGLDNVVTIYPKVSRQESLAIQRESNVIVFFSSSSPLYGGWYSTKIFEYLVSGTPIIVVGNKQENCVEMLVIDSGTGFVCGCDSDKVFDAIVRIAMGNLPTRNEKVIESFRRDRLADKLVNLVDQLCH